MSFYYSSFSLLLSSICWKEKGIISHLIQLPTLSRLRIWVPNPSLLSVTPKSVRDHNSKLSLGFSISPVSLRLTVISLASQEIKKQHAFYWRRRRLCILLCQSYKGKKIIISYTLTHRMDWVKKQDTPRAGMRAQQVGCWLTRWSQVGSRNSVWSSKCHSEWSQIAEPEVSLEDSWV